MNYADLNKSSRKPPKSSDVFWAGALLSFFFLPLGLLFAIAILLGSKE